MTRRYSAITVDTSRGTVDTVRIVLPEDSGPVMKNIACIFSRQVQARCAAKVVTSGKALFTVELAIEPGIGTEGFRIMDGKAGAVRIVGNDERGVLYGVGKFLRTSRYDHDGFTPGAWRGISVPEKPVRGIYFATHFYNYYHTAPIDEITRYIEELALWGINSLVVWFDMHHFAGFDDPEAVAHRHRLKAILNTARELGLDTGLTVVGNEGYGNSPSHLRTVPGGGRGCIFQTDICPMKTGGREYILGNFAQEFEWFASVRPAYLWIWPYDSGGCGCAQCQPWGAKGFLQIAEPLAALARQKLPGVKIIASTWYFDEADWQGLTRAFAEKKPWADYVLVEVYVYPAIKRPMPAGLPMIGFPEISMFNTFPWGGFGATPLPRHFQEQWDVVKGRSSGGFPYSEGIFEDINKVVYAQAYWNTKTTMEETLKEYIAYEYLPEITGEALGVIRTLEQNHHWRYWPGELEGVKLGMNWFPSRDAKPQADPGAEEAYAAVKKADAQLPAWARNSWRWRILYIRAMLDSELKTNGGKPNEICMAGFRELMEIYHVTDKTDPCMKPPIAAIKGAD